MSSATPALDLEHEAREIQALLEIWEATRHLPVDTWIGEVQEAFERARQLGNDVLLARSLIAVAFGHVVRLESVAALDLCQQALVLLEDKELTNLEATAHQMIGRVYYDLGNDESALEMFEQALLLTTDEALKLRLRGNIAAISIELGRLEEAIEVQAQILASPNATNLANTHSNMALALHRMSDQQLESGQETKAQELLEQAKHHIQIALQLSRASNEQDTEGHTLVTLAGMFKHQGNFSQAFVHYQEALVLAQRRT